MSFSADLPPAGWYSDPAGSGGERYWDGGDWSQVTRPVGGMAAGYAPHQGQPGGQQSPQNPYGATAYGQPIHGGGFTPQPVLAGFWWRVLAAFLDGLITAIPFGLLVFFALPGPIGELQQYFADSFNSGYLGTAMPDTPDAALAVLSIASGLLSVIYRTVMVAKLGGTLGQLITGLRVLPTAGQLGTPVKWGTSALRAVAAVAFGQVPILNIVDPLSMLFSARKQTLHDRIATTIVVKK
ncbi:MAG: RDD family protein [Propionibacteriaceae bacterium]|nr:RDD family protein [Propionibacteriaceae bacterium]